MNTSFWPILYLKTISQISTPTLKTFLRVVVLNSFHTLHRTELFLHPHIFTENIQGKNKGHLFFLIKQDKLLHPISKITCCCN